MFPLLTESPTDRWSDDGLTDVQYIHIMSNLPWSLPVPSSQPGSSRLLSQHWADCLWEEVSLGSRLPYHRKALFILAVSQLVAVMHVAINTLAAGSEAGRCNRAVCLSPRILLVVDIQAWGKQHGGATCLQASPFTRSAGFLSSHPLSRRAV